MKIKNTRLTYYSLPLHRRWHSNRQEVSARTGWLLQLEDTDGIKGFGDCAPIPTHGTETGKEAMATLESILPRLVGVSITECLELLPNTKLTPAARCALEMALLDLTTKHRGIPLHQWLNQGSSSRIKVNANIGTVNEDSLQRAYAAIDKGYSILKLKVGINDPHQEMELLVQLCSDLPKSVRLRLDANQAWDLATTRTFLNGIQGLQIESLEEPLNQPDIKALALLQDETEMVLALDETVAHLDIDNLSQLHPLCRIILKPTILGGILPSLQLGQHSQKIGIEAVVTSTVDSAAGVWAASQLAAALDVEGSLCHGLGTGEWLQQDLGKGPEIINGTITIPSTPGLGFTPYA